MLCYTLNVHAPRGAQRGCIVAQERWLTVAEIVEQLQVHEQTVRRWLREGRLPGRNFGGRTGYRVRQRDLEAFLAGEAQESESTTEGKVAA